MNTKFESLKEGKFKPLNRKAQLQIIGGGDTGGGSEVIRTEAGTPYRMPDGNGGYFMYTPHRYLVRSWTGDIRKTGELEGVHDDWTGWV